MSHQDTEQVITDFLDGQPRASEWRILREALESRERGLRQEQTRESEAGNPDRAAALGVQIAAIAKQRAILETEEAVSMFVEDSIRYAVARAPGGDGDEEGTDK